MSLLKEEGYAGVPHRSTHERPNGKGQPPPAGGKDGRHNLFGILQGTEVGAVRARAASLPAFKQPRCQVLSVVRPALLCAQTLIPDSWIGHQQINPTKGKGVALPPTDPKGRRDLFDVLHARRPGKSSGRGCSGE